MLDGAGPKPAESEGENGGGGGAPDDDDAIMPPPVKLAPDAADVPESTLPDNPSDDDPSDDDPSGDDPGDAPTDGDDPGDDMTFADIDVEVADEVFGDPLSYVEQIVHDRAVSSGLTRAIGFRRESRGLVVTIVTDQVLFAPGEAAIQPDGFLVLDVVADALLEVPNDVMIEGHTDSRPISTAQFPSNWELSTARATSVLRYLLDAREFPDDRVSAAGYADTRPVDAGTSADALARNRRVEVVVLATT